MEDIKLNQENILSDQEEESRNKTPKHKECIPVEDDCEYIVGNVSETIKISKDTDVCEIKADFEVSKQRTVRIWGQVKDCNGNPVKCALVKLVKQICRCGKIDYIGVAHTVTDCKGFYQFDVCVPENTEKYKVIVSKAASGKEIIKSTECDPCGKDKCLCLK
ncbi:hypothetical protein SAMN05661008_01115 [Alkalithermobacter thermoalcaliphilus JW-YL-7 = DSM 7308]|uniref:Uncharacterized protein n=1 Tax=Alkalithermobacter thermoalcaliphilus JW-YL-7 = DSM 7308 TaxID=1121328 RepID=A0A150FNG7_CLOPD|nr:hypothetical protein JWYL7_0202 [[Clostridium] paradoxum JW-YL-7 = DSM 7308]SHK91106.1 hypothetical protein SAMN05661008_01115 [[Clostridium] paradoxum JW-YL-7 = DSM 7308]